MANYSQLKCVNRPERPTDTDYSVLRYARNSVPLFWWGFFEQGDLSHCMIRGLDAAGEEADMQVLMLIKDKDAAIQRFSKFAAQLSQAKLIPNVCNYLETIAREIQGTPQRFLQLDSSELQMLSVGFDGFLSDGCRFGDSIHTGGVDNLQPHEALLEISGIYIQPQLASSDWEHSLIGTSPGHYLNAPMIK